MNSDDIKILAFTAKVSDLPAITAISNESDGDGMWRQRVKDIIPMPEGKCVVIISRQGCYPYMVNTWERSAAPYLSEIKDRLDRDAKESERRQEWCRSQIQRKLESRPGDGIDKGEGT